MRIRLGRGRLLALAALLAPLALPSVARASDTEIVVEGSRSAYADVVIKEYTQLPEAWPRLSTDGDLVGLVIEPVEVDYPGHAAYPPFGSVLVRRFNSSAVRVFAAGDLPPGRYRFWFFADGPSRAVLKVSRGGFTLRPTTPSHARAHSRRSTITAGQSAARHEYVTGVPARAYALLGVQATGLRAESTYACASTNRACDSPLLPVHIPSTNSEPAMGWAPPASFARDAVVGVDGLRAQDGHLSSLVLTFSS